MMDMFKNRIALLCVLGVCGGGASHAAMFTFTTNTSVNDGPKGDVLLESATADALGGTFSDFVYAQGVTIISNDPFTGGNSGAASTDRGDNVAATGGITNIEDPTASDIRNTFANNNLNSIVDGEDRGSFDLHVDFGQAIGTLFIWERGGNSKLGLQAINTDGQVVGDEVVVNSRDWASAGFRIDTTEIGGAQGVRSTGISDLGLFFGTEDAIGGVRVFAESSFNGPDFKIVAGSDALIPTPGAGALVAASLVVGLRRRRKA